MGETALLFAGQGAQKVGMGADLAEAYPASREVFETADRVLGFPLTGIMFEGPKEDLEATENAQPAVLAMGLACMRALESEGKLPEFSYAAGLSLGEYGAHVAAGSLGVEDALRLVRRRGELMRDAAKERPGGMASVLGLEPEKIEEACREASDAGLVGVANRNCPGQTVISGELAALEKASELCREKGAKRVVRLKVAGAFHTPLMAPAAQGLREEIERTAFSDPRVPVVQNCCAEKTTSASLLKERLIEQLTSPVLWERSMRLLISEGVDTFVELGPGKVLAGLLRRIDRSCRAASVGSAGDLSSLPLT